MKKAIALLLGLAVLAGSAACAEAVAAYADVRYFAWPGHDKQIYRKNEYHREDIYTFMFNEGTVLEGNEALAAQVMEEGRNPGLGVRELHRSGITGQGVNVGIIDQNLLTDHPEFAGKIAAYYDTGCSVPEDEGSMHAPAVTSILAGETIGVAPGVRVYFAAVPSWELDSAYYAKALYWLIEQNEKLPEGEKIRVVSVSAVPSGPETLFEKNTQMWDEAMRAAHAAGILVLDCGSGESRVPIAPAYYDPQQRENVERCRVGWPNASWPASVGEIAAPACYRTVAEEYDRGETSYCYDGPGGLSWAVPYVAGVLALGWQVNPQLSNEEIVQLLLTTACGENAGPGGVVNPAAFIEAIESRSAANPS